MFLNFLGKGRRIVDVKVEGSHGKIEKKHRILIVAVIAAIVFLAFGGSGDENKVSEIQNTGAEQILTYDDFVRETEERLEKMISTVNGVGKVHVMVFFDSKNEKILAADSTSKKESETGGEISTVKTSGEESVIRFGSGSDEKPFILKEKISVPAGIFVTAEGAENENIRLEIYEAVKALYGISGHRIKISPAKK